MVWVWSIPVHFVGPFGLYCDYRETGDVKYYVYGVENGGFIGEKPNNKIKDKREEIKSEGTDKSLRFSCSSSLRKSDDILNKNHENPFSWSYRFAIWH